METLKYKIINSKKQYKTYCDILEQLVFSDIKNQNTKDEIALLNLLIETWDKKHNSFHELDPVQLLQSFMKEKDLKAKDLVEILDLSKGYISDILHYKKGFSKEVIRKLADYFKVSQEAFNRPYTLVVKKDQLSLQHS
ncbi:MAG: helix-turn-helix domain-containing protein [Filimonas sp.]|nr:helix-turn-helix domain-containing protein [Filimonas sp.]